MQSPTFAIRQLLWKEWRQLWPLIAMLVGVVVFTLLLLSFQNAPSGITSRLLLALPGLYACGAGALLIGQEKETRSLNWLRSLPLSSRLVAGSKLLICFVGLAFTWMIVFALNTLILPQAFYSGAVPSAAETYVFVAQSVFILLVGYGLAWTFESSFMSLMILVPVAMIPIALCHIGALLTGVQDNTPLFQQACGFTISTFVALAGVFAWTSSQRALQPVSTGTSQRASKASQRRITAPLSPSLPSFQALVWQSWKQARWLWFGCGAVFMMPAIVSVASQQPFNDQFSYLLAITFLASAVVIAWLGAAVFGSDDINRRIRFLADRGLSPRYVFWSRHAIPASVISLGTVAMLAGFTIAMRENINLAVLLFCMAIVSSAIGIYIVSQWAGQFLRSPIIATIVAPALSVAAISFSLAAVMQFAAPWWLAAACYLLPILATRYLTSRWMDGRFDRTFWLTHASTAIAFFVIPLIPFVVILSTTKGLSPTIERELTQIVANQPSLPSPIYLRMQSPSNTDGKERTEIPVGEDGAIIPAPRFPSSMPIEERASYVLDGFIDQLDRVSDKAISFDDQALSFFQVELFLTRSKLQSTQSNDPERLSYYNELLRTSVRIAAGLRRNPKFDQQDLADRIEIILLAEVLADRDNKFMENVVRTQVLSQIGDRQARQKAREYSVAYNWKQFKNSQLKVENRLGGISLNEQPVTSTQVLAWHAHVGHITELLYQLARCEIEDAPEIREKLAMLNGYSPNVYADESNAVPTNGEISAQEAVSEAVSMFGYRGRLFAPLWNRNWERAAEKLASEPQSR